MFSLIPVTKTKFALELLKKSEDNKSSVIASVVRRIMSSYDYVYDPEHKKNPGSGYHKTEKGWSRAEELRSEITFSPEVNVPTQDDVATKKNKDEMHDIISKAISGVSPNVSFGVSKRKAGRYFENNESWDEESYSINLKGASKEQAFKIGKNLADLMKQSSVLVWDSESQSGSLVHNTEKSKGDFTFDESSVKFFLNPKDTTENVVKTIDALIKPIVGDRTTGTGWTIAALEARKVHKIGKKDYFPATNSLVIHGISEDYIKKIAVALSKKFKLPVLVRDMIKNTENIVAL